MKKLFLIPLILFSICGCSEKEKRTPLSWCIWEIQRHENYEDCTYTYQDIYPIDYKEESNYYLNAYVITTYTNDFRTEWYCFIEYKNNLLSAFPYKNIICIDCDILFEIEID